MSVGVPGTLNDGHCHSLSTEARVLIAITDPTPPEGVILSAAFANEAASSAREEILTLPIWFSQDDMTSKKQVPQRFKKKIALTLWKLYKIGKSLHVSALGTSIT
ncbi:hypothetical protein AVEN_142545-1 [Araneus ventricosus]|uniref:Uncharacterized protein n=1 Tax=Araneus ventricosus TaxID=182803 RepID=A0A4Y2CH17_ARAVE|nr:hypothetical protein AVEN_142545-1 [Araneus ventricosus]